MQPDFHARKTAAEARIDDLRRQAGAAQLDGKAFDFGKLDSAQSDLLAIEVEEEEHARRVRQAAEEGEVNRRARARRRMETVTTDLSTSLDAMEAATRSLAEAYSAVKEHVAELQTLSTAVSPRRMVALSDIEDRLVRRMGIVLRSASGGPVAKIGSVSFPMNTDGADHWFSAWGVAEATPIREHFQLKG